MRRCVVLRERLFVAARREPTLFLGKSLDVDQHHNEVIRKRSTEMFSGEGAYIPPAAFGFDLPGEGIPEIAFVGRSNVGKSTLLGALIGDSKLVRASKRPGCTRSVNFFAVGSDKHGKQAVQKAKEKRSSLSSKDAGLKRRADTSALFLVDLPGYGYAQRSREAQEGWQMAMSSYLTQRHRGILRHVVVVVDARHGIYQSQSGEGDDDAALGALSAMGVAHHIVLSKADLAHPLELLRTVESTFEYMQARKKSSSCMPIVHCVSAKTGMGIAELRDNLASVAHRETVKKGEATGFEREIEPLGDRDQILLDYNPYGPAN